MADLHKCKTARSEGARRRAGPHRGRAGKTARLAGLRPLAGRRNGGEEAAFALLQAAVGLFAGLQKSRRPFGRRLGDWGLESAGRSAHPVKRFCFSPKSQ